MPCGQRCYPTWCSGQMCRGTGVTVCPSQDCCCGISGCRQQRVPDEGGPAATPCRTLAGLAVNVMLNLCQIPLHGATGAAIAMLISYFVIRSCSMITPRGPDHGLLMLGSTLHLASLGRRDYRWPGVSRWIFLRKKRVYSIVCILLSRPGYLCSVPGSKSVDNGGHPMPWFVYQHIEYLSNLFSGRPCSSTVRATHHIPDCTYRAGGIGRNRRPCIRYSGTCAQVRRNRNGQEMT